MIRLAVPAFLLIAACATTGAADQRWSARTQARFDRALEGLRPGEPRRCVPRDRVTELRSFPDTILFVGGRNRLYRNRIVGSCAGLARDDIVVTSSPTSQYCDGDLVQTRARLGGAMTGSCSLGEFIPYTK